MFRDIKGQNRVKIGIHCHTTLSDGRKTPEEVYEIYRNAGYDALAVTDHWHWSGEGEYKGMLILSGAEYNIGGGDGAGFVRGEGVYHITAIGASSEPKVPYPCTTENITAAIHEAGGFAVLAHPAWSLNDPSIVAGMDYFDATEIFNTVSGVHESCRADSSMFVDLLACRGMMPGLVAADDAHYYDGTDAPVASVCVRADKCTREAILNALMARDYYATTGPEVMVSYEGGVVNVECTPASKVCFYSNSVWADKRVIRGESVTHAEYRPAVTQYTRDTFVRVEITEAGNSGKKAWSNIIRID